MTFKTKCVIIDDEPLARALILEHLSHFDGFKVVGSFENAIEAANYLRQHMVDLIFVDVQMPVMSGIDFLRTLKARPKIIVTTAFREYAFEAFELDVDDYLLKPITMERFMRSINKVLSTPRPASHEQAENEPGYYFFKAARQYVRLSLDDIRYIESSRDKTLIHCGDESVLSSERISALADKLPPAQFIRIHRSFIIGRRHMERFSQRSVTVASKELPIGRQYQAAVLRQLRMTDTP